MDVTASHNNNIIRRTLIYCIYFMTVTRFSNGICKCMYVWDGWTEKHLAPAS